MPALVVFHTPPDDTPMYQVCLFPGCTAIDPMRPEAIAGPTERRRNSSKVADANGSWLRAPSAVCVVVSRGCCGSCAETTSVEISASERRVSFLITVRDSLFQRDDQYFAARAGVQRAIGVGDGVERKARGDAGRERLRSRAAQRGGNDRRQVLESDKTGARTVLGHEDGASLHELREIDGRQRAGHLPVIHETPARCEQSDTRAIGRGADGIEHGR